MKQHASITEKAVQLDALQSEIVQLQAQLPIEKDASKLNDIRLRLRFLKWKMELLSIATGKKH